MKPENIMDQTLEPLMSRSEVAKYIANYLRVSFRMVYDRYVAMPGFPKPIELPSSTGRKTIKRWNKTDIYEWMTGQKKAL